VKAAVSGRRGDQLVATLTRWYRKHGRTLPWRSTRDPYAIWVAEIMLQQTQADRVIPFFERFLKRFPSVEALSGASWRGLLPFWRGLGYYGRLRNMAACAKIVATERSGSFPRDPGELEALPGIGPYTAAAIASFAFHRPVPALDTNLRRVLARVFGTDEKMTARGARELFARHRRHAATLNHALMDLGALVCRARTVRCDLCPLQDICEFALQGRTISHSPRTASRRRTGPRIDVGAACIHRNGKYLIALRATGVWEFPGGKREAGEDIRACLKREIMEELGVEISVRPPFRTVDFEKNEAVYRVHFCKSQLLRGRPRAIEHQEIRWVSVQEFSQFEFAETNQAVLGILSGGKRKA
jgi:A/G-specific adenine glycosylase